MSEKLTAMNSTVTIEVDDDLPAMLREVAEIVYRTPGGYGYHYDELRRLAREIESGLDKDSGKE